MTRLPLEGVRILEWARNRPAPAATRKLADLGADVVKITDVGSGGAAARAARDAATTGARDSFSLADAQLLPTTDRNKWSVGLDFSRAADRAQLRQLAEAADVVVEGSRPGALQARSGLDLHEIRRSRPRLVVCTITGLGMTGPHSHHPTHGLNLDAMAGLLSLNRGDAGWQLHYTGTVVELGSLNAVIAIQAALRDVERGNNGAWIDISCLDCGIDMQRNALNAGLADELGVDPDALGPRGTVYEAADGRCIVLAAIERKFWLRLCAALGREDLLDHWSELGRADEALRSELQAVFLTKTASQWHRWFLDNDVPGSYVLGFDELLADPQVEARQLVAEGPDGHNAMLSDAVRWADIDERPGSSWRLASAVGADNEAVLARWLASEA